MVFNSVEFLVFFAVTAGIFFIVPRTVRWIVLLIASYYFYMSWSALYVGLILFSTIIDYGVGIALSERTEQWRRRVLLSVSIVTNVGLLMYFKYTVFALDNISAVASLFDRHIDTSTISIVLPLGISFYTFQTLGYTIDVYRRKITAERHLGRFALFVTFFPQLIAGPIERAKDLIPQLSSTIESADIDYQRCMSGARLILWGLFKKVVIADTLAKIVNPVYADVGSFSSLALILATMAFGYQIYCDFSGYVDIARGAARIFGVRLSRNFNRPYAATSVANFWRRWHITLYDWFKEYIYIPLGGSRKGVRRWAVNVLIVFLISGLWHGASWHFVVWGLLHGLFIIVERFFSARIRTTHNGTALLDGTFGTIMRIAATYLVVHIAWVFFRAESIPQALAILSSISGVYTDLFNVVGVITTDVELLFAEGVYALDLLSMLLLIPAVELVQLIQDRKARLLSALWKKPWAAYSVYAAMVVLIVLFLNEESQEFIYFQF